MSKTSWGNRLIEVLNSREITKYRIAKDLKIHQTTIAKYVDNLVDNPHPTIINKISNYLKINPEWLLTGKGESDKLAESNEAGLVPLSDTEILKVLEALHLHRKQLDKYKMFRVWLRNENEEYLNQSITEAIKEKERKIKAERKKS